MKRFMQKKKMLCAALVICLIAAVGCWGISVRKAAKRDAAAGSDAANQVKALDYSKYYNEDGTLKEFEGKVSDYVKLCEYQNLELLYSDLNLEEDADEETISRKLDRYLKDYLTDSCEITELRDDFIAQQTDIMEYELKQEYEFERAVKELSYGTSYDTIYDYYGVEEDEYEDYVSQQGVKSAALAVIVQAIAEEEKIIVTHGDVEKYLDRQKMEQDYDELSLEYGEGYLYHITMQDKVFTFIKSRLTLKKDGE